MAPNAGSFNLEIGLQGNALGYLDALSSHLEHATKRFRALASVVIVAQGMQNVGRQILRIKDILLNQTITPSVAAFRDFEKRMEEVRFVTSATADEFERLRQTAIRIGIQTIHTPSDAAEALYELGSAGYNAAQSIQTVDTALRYSLLSGGLVDTGSAVQTLAVALNKFNLEAGDAPRVLDSMAQAIRTSLFHPDEFLEFFDGLKSAPALTGATVEEMLSLGIVMRSVGNSSRQSAENINQFVNRIIQLQNWMQFYQNRRMTGTRGRMLQARVDWAREMGVSLFDAAGQRRSILEVLSDIQRNARALTSDQERAQRFLHVFGRAGQQVVTAMVEGGMDLNQVYSSLNESMGISEELSQRLLHTFDGVVQLWRGTRGTLGIQLGETLAPTLAVIINAIRQIGNGIIRLFEAVPALKAIVGLLIAVNVVLLAVTGSFLLFTGGLIAFLAPLGLFAHLIGSLGPMLATLANYATIGAVYFTNFGLAMNRLSVNTYAATGAMASLAQAQRSVTAARAGEAAAWGVSVGHLKDTLVQILGGVESAGLGRFAVIGRLVLGLAAGIFRVALAVGLLWAAFSPFERMPQVFNYIERGVKSLISATGGLIEVLSNVAVGIVGAVAKLTIMAVPAALAALGSILKSTAFVGIHLAKVVWDTIVAVGKNVRVTIQGVFDPVVTLLGRIVTGQWSQIFKDLKNALFGLFGAGVQEESTHRATRQAFEEVFRSFLSGTLSPAPAPVDTTPHQPGRWGLDRPRADALRNFFTGATTLAALGLGARAIRRGALTAYYYGDESAGGMGMARNLLAYYGTNRGKASLAMHNILRQATGRRLLGQSMRRAMSVFTPEQMFDAAYLRDVANIRISRPAAEIGAARKFLELLGDPTGKRYATYRRLSGQYEAAKAAIEATYIYGDDLVKAQQLANTRLGAISARTALSTTILGRILGVVHRGMVLLGRLMIKGGIITPQLVSSIASAGWKGFGLLALWRGIKGLLGNILGATKKGLTALGGIKILGTLGKMTLGAILNVAAIADVAVSIAEYLAIRAMEFFTRRRTPGESREFAPTEMLEFVPGQGLSIVTRQRAGGQPFPLEELVRGLTSVREVGPGTISPSQVASRLMEAHQASRAAYAQAAARNRSRAFQEHLGAGLRDVIPGLPAQMSNLALGRLVTRMGRDWTVQDVLASLGQQGEGVRGHFSGLIYQRIASRLAETRPGDPYGEQALRERMRGFTGQGLSQTQALQAAFQQLQQELRHDIEMLRFFGQDEEAKNMVELLNALAVTMEKQFNLWQKHLERGGTLGLPYSFVQINRMLAAHASGAPRIRSGGAGMYETQTAYGYQHMTNRGVRTVPAHDGSPVSLKVEVYNSRDPETGRINTHTRVVSDDQRRRRLARQEVGENVGR